MTNILDDTTVVIHRNLRILSTISKTNFTRSLCY